jgi:lactate racemase
VATKLRHDPAADARAALTLAQALDRGPVYLRSRLPDDVVESLGMTPIASDAELSRLASGRRHCVVIEEAQRVKPRLLRDPHAVE